MDLTANLLPPNATQLEKDLDAVDAKRLNDLVDTVDLIATLWNPHTCPMQFLPWLAWAFSVDEWDTSWDEQTKRNMVAQSYELHSIKGTPAAVRKALEAMGYEDVEIIEAQGHKLDGTWLLDGSQKLDNTAKRFFFDVRFNTLKSITEDEVIEIIRRINYYKNARSHLGALRRSTTYLDGTWILDGTGTLNDDVLALVE